MLLLLGAVGLGSWLTSACAPDEDQGAGGTATITFGGDVVQPKGSAQASSLAAIPTIDYIPTDYRHAPGGMLWHRDCIHVVPDGAVIHSDLSVSVNGTTVSRHTACAHPVYRFASAAAAMAGDATRSAPSIGDGTRPAPGTGNGWVESTWAFSTEPMFTQMNSGSWSVPSGPPSNNGQLLYMFPSFQGAGYIIQPVLQWGQSPIGGGAYWAYASWAVFGQTALYATQLKGANPGDQMSGQLALTFNDSYNGEPRQYWKITSNNNTQGTTSSITATLGMGRSGGNFTSAQAGVLEAYSVANCNNFPNGSSGWTYFSKPVLYQGYSYLDRHLVIPPWGFSQNWLTDNPAWGGPTCGFGGTVDNLGNTTLNY